MLNNKKPRVAWCVRSAVLMTVSLLFPSTSLHAAQSLTLLTWVAESRPLCLPGSQILFPCR